MKGWLARPYHQLVQSTTYAAAPPSIPVAVARTAGARCSAPYRALSHSRRAQRHPRARRTTAAGLSHNNTNHLLSWIWKDPSALARGHYTSALLKLCVPREGGRALRAADHSERKARPMLAASAMRRPGSGWLGGFVSHYHVVYSVVDPSPSRHQPRKH
jgi:hypothetical protein